MTDSLTTALERQAQPKEVKTVRDLIQRMKPELEKSLQSREAAEILMRHYMTAIRLNPLLHECTSESLLAALLLSAQMRLEPGPLGHVYLVPFKGECVWMLGYTGMLELARRSERVAMLKARVVWDCDECQVWEDEKGEHYRYTEGPEQDRTERLYVVTTWKELAGGRWFPRVVKVPKSRIDRAREASPAARKSSGPWVSDETAMWAKTGIRAVRVWLPLSPDLARAAAVDDAIVHSVTVDSEGAAQPELLADTALADEGTEASGE